MNSIYMVETATTPHGVWMGISVHTDESDANSACPADGRVTSFVVSSASKSVKEISARIANRQPFKNECPCPVCIQLAA